MTELICPIKNWVPLETAFHAVTARPKGSPRMVLVHGKPGLGKTTAVGRLHLRTEGAYLYASTMWTKKTLVTTLAERLGVTVRARDTGKVILDTVLEKLQAMKDALIVIDEFDRISHNRELVELVREIHDISDVPVAVVGMGTIEQDLKRFEQFDQRIGKRVLFKKIDTDDARRIADVRCGVALTDDLLAALLERSSGIIRNFVTELADAEALGKREGIETVGAADMGL